VSGFDGRTENVAEARRRFPGIAFEQGDVESGEILKLGTFDLTLCFGLLYHLENPMLAIRRLRALTGKGLLLESMCIPGSQAGMVLREEPAAADQSLTEIGLYPSEACLVKMLVPGGLRGGISRGGAAGPRRFSRHSGARASADRAVRVAVGCTCAWICGDFRIARGSRSLVEGFS